MFRHITRLVVLGVALAQTFQQTGTLGLEVAGVAGGNFSVVTGPLVLNSVPPGAVVVQATLYTSGNSNPSGLHAVFNGVTLGTIGPSASDAHFLTLYTYRWNVTNFVTPPSGPFNFTITESLAGLGIAGVTLVVVWSDPAAAIRTITIVEGMQQVGEAGPETESATFTGLPGGATTAWLFTVYDDASASGEVVAYNGTAIGGPIDQGLGFSATLLQLSATSVSGNNTLAITTGSDHMGWMIAATAVDIPPTGALPFTWGRIKDTFARKTGTSRRDVPVLDPELQPGPTSGLRTSDPHPIRSDRVSP